MHLRPKTLKAKLILVLLPGLLGLLSIGQIPAQLKDLPNLAFLDLSQNNIAGSIPNELGDISNLEELYLSENPSLTGALPQSLSNLVYRT